MGEVKKYRAVKYDGFGGIDVLHIDELPVPVPTGKQVLVKVKVAGLNPIETKIRKGLLAKSWPSTFPSGQGSDFAGVVETVGSGVTEFKAGDEVIGFVDNRSGQAEYVLAEVEHLVRRPPHVPWEQAGALFTSGTTAYAELKAVLLKRGDTVGVSGATGGVGSIAIQLAHNVGAKVIGIASEANHDWLAGYGAIPVAYGDGLADRVKAAAGGHVDAFIDCHGEGYVELAIQLGVPPDRIDTIVDFAAVEKYHVKNEGNLAAGTAKVLGELAGMIEQGQFEIPVAKVFALGDVRAAYAELEKGHTRGKIVLEM